MPFITEEIWQTLNHKDELDSIMVQPWPVLKESDQSFLSGFDTASGLIMQIRNIRKQKNIPFKKELPLVLMNVQKQTDNRFNEIIKRLGNISSISFSDSKPENSIGFISKDIQSFLIVEQEIDSDEERKRILSELDYQKGFLQSVLKKLNNPSFVSKAKPEVIASEEKKKSDAESKINALQEQLDSLH